MEEEAVTLSDNWVIQNLTNVLTKWNEKLAEVWQLLTQSPQDFKGGAIWQTIVSIHTALQAIGLAMLVLFFVVGIVKTCSTFAEVKRPEHVLKLFVRFAIAKGLVTYGMELMLALFQIFQGVAQAVMDASGLSSVAEMTLPQEMVKFEPENEIFPTSFVSPSFSSKLSSLPLRVKVTSLELRPA